MMKQNLSEEWQEFYHYVDFCIYAAGFKEFNANEEKNILAIEDDEKVLAVYNNPGETETSTLWLSNRGIFVKLSPSAEIMKIPYESINNVRPGFNDILDAQNNPEYRTIILNLKEGNQIIVPMAGTTFGDLDLLKIGFVIMNAHLAMGTIKLNENKEKMN